MGLFYPMLLVPDVHPPPPRFWCVTFKIYGFTLLSYLCWITFFPFFFSYLLTYWFYFTRFNDYEDMLADTWHMEFPRRSDMSDGLYSSINGGFPMWDSYSFFQTKPKKEDCIGLAEAITKSILSTGRLLSKVICSHRGRFTSRLICLVLYWQGV